MRRIAAGLSYLITGAMSLALVCLAAPLLAAMRADKRERSVEDIGHLGEDA